LVPVFYAISVLDLKIVKWDTAPAPSHSADSEVPRFRHAAAGHER
jgi:hypothetical protein